MLRTMSMSCAPSLRTSDGFSALRTGERCAEREADDDSYGNACAGKLTTASGTQVGLTMAQAKR